MGDSTAYGMFDFEKGGWSNRLQARLMQEGAARILDSTIVANRALPGFNLRSVLKEMPEAIAQYARFSQEVAVAAQIGLNEAKKFPPNDKPVISTQQFGKQVLSFCNIAEEHGAFPLLVGQAPLDMSRDIPTLSGAILDDAMIAIYGETIKASAHSVGHTYVDLRQSFAECPSEAYLGPDNSHLNGFGHQVVADAVYDALPDSFKRK